MRHVSFIVLAGLLLAGCMRARPPELPIALGPYGFEEQTALFGAVSSAMGEAGYPVAVSQPDGGRLIAAAHTRVRNEQPMLTVQLYREGWVAVSAGLPSHPRHAIRVRQEAERLSVHIAEHLERSGFERAGQP